MIALAKVGRESIKFTTRRFYHPCFSAHNFRSVVIFFSPSLEIRIKEVLLFFLKSNWFRYNILGVHKKKVQVFIK